MLVTATLYEHWALTRKSDAGHRPPQIDMISHPDTNADMPLICCLPPWLGPHVFFVWPGEGVHTFCVPKQLKQVPWEESRRGSSSWAWWRMANVIQWRQKPRGDGYLFSAFLFTYTNSLWHWTVTKYENVSFSDHFSLMVLLAKCTHFRVGFIHCIIILHESVYTHIT